MEEQGFFSSLYTYGWKPTNEELLKKSEEDLLGILKEPYELDLIEVEEFKINTLKMGQPENTPLILIHGFGSGIGQWVRNLDHLAKNYRIYACDLIGFGRSSRPQFAGETVEEAETYFLQILHKWILKLETGPYVLCGHSMGAYLSSVYLLNYADHNCAKLILADPWGIPLKTEDLKSTSWKFSIGLAIANNFSPLSVLRAAGPYGPSLFTSIRSDLVGKFEDLEDPGIFIMLTLKFQREKMPSLYASVNHISYLQKLQHSFAWARKPLIDRLPQLTTNTPVVFIYGKRTWMDKQAGKVLKNTMTGHKVSMHILPDAGHHVMIDNHAAFNSLMDQLL